MKNETPSPDYLALFPKNMADTGWVPLLFSSRAFAERYLMLQNICPGSCILQPVEGIPPSRPEPGDGVFLFSTGFGIDALSFNSTRSEYERCWQSFFDPFVLAHELNCTVYWVDVASPKIREHRAGPVEFSPAYNLWQGYTRSFDAHRLSDGIYLVAAPDALDARSQAFQVHAGPCG